MTVTYSETAMSGDNQSPAAASGRVRTFRKLYQFLAQQCLAVRTKAGALPLQAPVNQMQPKGQGELIRFVLEAQLENMAEEALTLEVGIELEVKI